MPTLDEIIAQTRERNGKKCPMPAGRVVTLEPRAYLEECDGKPSSAIALGLRTPNDEDYSLALAAETDTAAMLSIVSTGVCDPNDCTRHHPSFPFPDLQIPKQLKPATIRYLFDEIERLHIETSPAVKQATDEELFLLGDALIDGDRLGRLEEASPHRAARVRRLATAITEALEVEV